MSEITCEVVQIDQLIPHDNADTLSVVHVYNYPVIVKTEQFEVGTKAVYFPVDACLPKRDVFSFLWKKQQTPTRKQRSIKAVKLRGVFSMGLLIPLDEILTAYPDVDRSKFEVGNNVAEILGVEKYEPPEEFSMGGDNEKQPSWFIHYTDIENIRKYHKVLEEGEEVVALEKVHGSNARYIWYEDRLWVGSHRNCKKLGGDDVWNIVARKHNLEERLQKCPGLIFFGEVYGLIQKGFDYGLRGVNDFILFDIYDISAGHYLDWDRVREIGDDIGLPRVPELYRGKWTKFEDLEVFADGLSVVAGESHIREGFVLRPIKERFDDRLGRVIVKLHGQDFLTGKKRKKK